MKKQSKIFAALLALVLLIGCAGACAGGGQSEQQQINLAESAEYHPVEGTLHKVYVTPSDRTFITSAGTEYKVVVGEESEAAVAAAFIVTHLAEATGITLAYEQNPVWSQTSKYIVVGNDDLFTQAGLSMPEDDIGFTGYYIRTAGDSVFLATNGGEGYQLAAIRFLNEVIGYDMLAEDLVIYEKDGATLPDMEITERPDFDYRVMSEPIGSAAQYGMGYTNNGVMMAVNNCTWHNSFQYLPPETYKDDYPEWYTENTIQLGITSETHGANLGQLCYLAGGDEDSFKEMVDTAYAVLKETVDANPALSNIPFTQEDNYEWCTCDACTKYIAEHGGANVSTAIKFVNALAEKLEADLAEEGSDRRVIISFFAYRASKQSPTQQNSSGEYEPAGGIHCHENVGVIIAPIEATFTHSFYETENESDAENIKSWAAVCDNIYIWLYQTNFDNYMYPLGTWDTCAEMYRFCKENNAVYMYSEGQWNTYSVSHFSKLKEYLDAKLFFDVNQSYTALVDKFFKYFYGSGGEYMKQFFEGVQSQYCYLETAYPAMVTGKYKESIAVAEYWPKKMLDGWLELVDKAYDAISRYDTDDSARYAAYREHVCIESMFPRYALCTLYSGSFSVNELQEMRSAFKEDSVALGMNYRDEQTQFTTVFNGWGV